FSTQLTEFSTIFHTLKAHRVPYWCANWRASEEQNITDFYAHLEREPTCRWAFHYFPRLDGLMHYYGPQGASKRLYWYEYEVRKMEAFLRERDWDYDITIMSDHGMTPIHQHINMVDYDGTKSLRWGKDYLALYDATLARYWFLNEHARAHITEALGNVDFGHWLTHEELETEGLLFPDQRYGEAYFLMDPGVLIHPNDMGQNPPKGMHGYAPEDKHSTATILSTHPKARKILKNTPRINQFYDLMASVCV
ncbi:MAG: alkaline phosphatase family protein, partial [Myxococcota bacterium]